MDVIEKASQLVVSEVIPNQDNRMSVAYSKRIRTQSLDNLIDSSESPLTTAAYMTPPVTRSNKESPTALSDSTDSG